MSEFAELFKSASSRVAFQRVHRATNVAHDLRVMGMPFQLEAFIVERLEKLLRALEEQVPEFGCPLVGEEGHVRPRSFGTPCRYSRAPCGICRSGRKDS